MSDQTTRMLDGIGVLLTLVLLLFLLVVAGGIIAYFILRMNDILDWFENLFHDIKKFFRSFINWLRGDSEVEAEERSISESFTTGKTAYSGGWDSNDLNCPPMVALSPEGERIYTSANARLDPKDYPVAHNGAPVWKETEIGELHCVTWNQKTDEWNEVVIYKQKPISKIFSQPDSKENEFIL